MESDIKELLRKNLEVSERTLQLVQKMHRASLWSRFFTLLKWIIIIGGVAWGYLAIQPVLQKALGISQQIGDLQKTIPSGGGFDSLLKSFLNK